MANVLLYLYCFSLPYQAITVGGIALVKLTGLILSGYLLLEVGKKQIRYPDLVTIALVVIAPIYLILLELVRTENFGSLGFFVPLISNIVLFTLMLISSQKLNMSRALFVLVMSSLALPIVMITPFADVGEDGRLSAFGLNPNFSAILLSLTFVYLVTAARHNRDIWKGFGLLCLSTLALFGVLGTGTRFGLLICSLFVAVTVFREIAVRVGPTAGLFTTAALLSFLGVLAFYADLVVIGRLLELDETLFTQGRLFLWGLAVSAVGADYIFGMGPNAYADFIIPIMGSYMSPHNVFFEFYIYGGALGSLLCLPLIYFASIGIRNSSWLSGDKDIYYFVSIILLAILFLHHITFNKLFWFLMAFICHARFMSERCDANNAGH